MFRETNVDRYVRNITVYCKDELKRQNEIYHQISLRLRPCGRTTNSYFEYARMCMCACMGVDRKENAHKSVYDNISVSYTHLDVYKRQTYSCAVL